MDKKIYYTINKDPNYDEDNYIISLVYEDDLKAGYEASFSFEKEVWDKIESIDLIEIMEGYFESTLNDIEELKTLLNNQGFIEISHD